MIFFLLESELAVRSDRGDLFYFWLFFSPLLFGRVEERDEEVGEAAACGGDDPIEERRKSANAVWIFFLNSWFVELQNNYVSVRLSTWGQWGVAARNVVLLVCVSSRLACGGWALERATFWVFWDFSSATKGVCLGGLDAASREAVGEAVEASYVDCRRWWSTVEWLQGRVGSTVSSWWLGFVAIGW